MEGITIKRDLLLVEIERRCFFADCNAKTLIGLTKEDALDYRGFECPHCKRWNDDSLAERDVSEWWSDVKAHRGSDTEASFEIQLTGLLNKGKSSDQKPSTRPRSEPGVCPQWALEAMRPIVRFVSHVCWKLKYQGIEYIPANGGLIIASNHQTYLDPCWISLPIKRPVRYLAWKVAFDWPIVGKLMTGLGAWPLQIEGSDPAAIRRTLQWLRDGGAIVIFPEGGRSESRGSMMRFKAGAVRLALEANVPILPVTIRGANRIWPRGWRFPRLGKVEITYHPLYHVEQQPAEEARSCASRESQRLAKIIASAL